MFVRTRSILVGLALLGMAAPACTRATAPPPAAAADPIAVTVATVGMADVAGTFEAGGVVEARTTATLMARIVAPILDVRVAPGDRVRAGQLLIVLDSRDLAAQSRRARAAALSADQDVIAAESERQAADATLALARATHARVAALRDKRSATAQELDDAAAALRAAEARAASAAARARSAAASVEGAKAASDGADTTETFSRIVAPFDGVVTEKLVEPGNMAAPGTRLLRVEDARAFRLDVRVDESRIGQIAPGNTVPVELDAGADGVPRTVSGTIAEIGRAVDADTRAFLVKISLPAESGLRSGMFGRAHFSTRPRRALTVPVAALVHRGQLTSVFVVEKDVARMRLVNVSGTEVLAGLAEGDVIIVGAPSIMSDGRRVRTGGR
ncbi:MAG TPA: efflux RND transporter periplasmic adaptor subunit [Vicinamibacterales bacterium]|nr:efflux RND transporter periplasmic adaptor subunit [Vicinamibacterales bacterium]